MSTFGHWGRRRSFGLAALAGLAADPTPAPEAAKPAEVEKLTKDARRVVSAFVAGKAAKAENFESTGLKLSVNGQTFASRANGLAHKVRVCPGNINTLAQRQAANTILSTLHAGTSIVPRSPKDPQLAISGRKGRRGLSFTPAGGCFEVHVNKRQRQTANQTFVATALARRQSGDAIPDAKLVQKIKTGRAKKMKLEKAAKNAEKGLQTLQKQVDEASTHVFDVQTKPYKKESSRPAAVKRAQNKVNELEKKRAAKAASVAKLREKAAALPG